VRLGRGYGEYLYSQPREYSYSAGSFGSRYSSCRDQLIGIRQQPGLGIAVLVQRLDMTKMLAWSRYILAVRNFGQFLLPAQKFVLYSIGNVTEPPQREGQGGSCVTTQASRRSRGPRRLNFLFFQVTS
jgi:hypothetical protein